MLYFILKPLATTLIYLWVWTHGDGGAFRYRRLILLGLLFSLAGDILLMIPADLFVAGLVAFLLAHLVYISAFVDGVPLRRLLPAAVPYALAAAGLVAFLWPSIPPGMHIPIVCYSGVIACMAGSALGRLVAAPHRSSRLAAAGALLFMVSDSALAINRFRSPFRHATLVVLGTYYAAQALIALSAAASRRRTGAPLPPSDAIR